MSLFQKNNYLVIIAIVTLFISCNNNSDSTYYKKTIKDWNAYIKALDVDEIKLEKAILLVLKGSECASSVAELQWWDNFQLHNSEFNIQLIILEKYATSFNAFLEYEKIQIPAIRDSSGILYDHDLLPRTPMKIFIDKKGDVKRIAPIGADIDPAQDAFIASLNI